jgi:multimeric flavodoxin WrbA
MGASKKETHVKKALLITALAATFVAPPILLTTPVSAQQIVAQSSEVLDSIRSEMEFLRQRMASTTLTGNTDKDYMTTMKMLHDTMMKINSIEMKSGKDTHAMKMATDSMKAFHDLDNYTHEAHG